MLRTRIKICGVCRPEDALAAAAFGADAIGMVLHATSERLLSEEQAADIRAVIPPFVTPVGLFVDAEPALIRHSAGIHQLAAAQLHGNESPQIAALIRPLPFIKALHVDANIEQTLISWRQFRSHLPHWIGILLETAGTAPGGTGLANDWAAIERLKASGALNDLPPLILAGGLTPENVGDVVRRLRPYAVDVSSGVESAKREKSKQKMRAFVAAVRAADENST